MPHRYVEQLLKDTEHEKVVRPGTGISKSSIDVEKKSTSTSCADSVDERVVTCLALVPAAFSGPSLRREVPRGVVLVERDFLLGRYQPRYLMGIQS